MSGFFTEALPYLFTGFFGAVPVWLLFWYLRSLLFYWRNGWDFSVDFGPPMAWGEELPSSKNEMRPREKVFCGYPITVLISAYLFGMSLYLFWGRWGSVGRDGVEIASRVGDCFGGEQPS